MQIFLGSSREAEDLLNKIGTYIAELKHDPLLWTDDRAFPLGSITFPRLLTLTQQVDASILIFSKDDKVWYRKDLLEQPRDNVLIEYGLFAGALGSQRTIICFDGKTKFASDLGGVNGLDASLAPLLAKNKLRIWLDELLQLKDAVWKRSQQEKTLREGVEVLRTHQQQAAFPKADSSYREVLTALEGQVGSQLLERESTPAVLLQETHLAVDEKGNCQCRYRRQIRSIGRPQSSVTHWLEGDVPVPHRKDLALKVEPLTDGLTIGYLFVKDNPNSKSILLIFRPEIAVDTIAEYAVSWRWPRVFERLARGEPDSWVEEIKSVTPVPEARIWLHVHPALPKLAVSNTGDGAGELSYPEPGPADGGYVQYLWTLRDVPSPTRVDIQLKPL